MSNRVVAGVLFAAGLFWGGVCLGDPPRSAEERPYVLEVGDPVLVSRDVLRRELARNTELRDYVQAYGWPDYAEVQEVVPQYPLYPYEVRMYYLARNLQVVYSRAFVNPGYMRFGIQTYRGPISQATLQRILTARTETTQTGVNVSP